jgi:starch synthase
MRVDIISKEYPPAIYGGAGVHVAELVRALRARGDVDVQVRCFGAPRDEAGTTAYPDLPELASANAALQTFGVDITIAADCQGADLVHSHTWYANLAGHVGGLLAGAPHVITAHSLEPMRPWKAEQLGGGYRVSSFAERTAYEGAAAVIAVSAGMRADILRSYPSLDPAKVPVVHNGIDSQLWQPIRDEEVCRKHGMDPDRRRSPSSGGSPGRRACPTSCAPPPGCPRTSRSSCAPAPPTPRRSRPRSRDCSPTCAPSADGVVWIPEMLPRREVIALLTASTVFACPSVYEPLGIVNLEAMACELPGRRHGDGRHPEVVMHGETGWLVPIEQVQDGTGTPVDPEKFVATSPPPSPTR